MNRPLSRILTGTIALLVTAAASSGAVYDWSGSSDLFWDKAANWTPNGVPATGDTANLNDTATDRVIIYPSAGGATVGTINFIQTSAATNALDVQKSLTVTNPITLSSAAGIAELRISPQGTSGSSTTSLTVPTLTIGTGGRLVLGVGGVNGLVSQLSGNLVMTGGELFVTDSLPPNGAAQRTVNGTATITGGTIRIGTTTAVSGTTEARLQINGNATISNALINGAASAQFILNGATTSFASNVTLGSSVQTVLSSASSAQSLTSDITLNSLFLRSFNSGNFVRTVTVNAPGQNVGSISFATQTANSSISLKLGSNLTTKTGAALPNMSGVSQQSPVTLGIDAAGFTLDVSNTAGTWYLNEAGQGTGGGVVTWALSNSGTAGAGRIKTNGFGFTGRPSSPDTVNVGAGLVLEANGGSAHPNDLGGGGAIDPTSVFRYTGGATAAAPATLTSNRPVGAIEVGSGTSAGALRLAGSFTAAGAVTVNNLGSLDLSAQTLSATIGATLEAGGTLRGGNGSTAGTLDGALISGGTLAPGTVPAASGTTIGTIAISGLLTSNEGSRLSLEIVSGSSFDKITAGSVALNGAVGLELTLGASYVHVEGTTFQILENTGSNPIGGTAGLFTWSGSEGALTEGELFTVGGNIFEISYVGGSGGNDVVLTAVPEPSAWLALVSGAGMLVSWRRFRSGRR